MQYQTGNPVTSSAGSSSFNGITGLPRPTQVGPVVRSKQQLAGITNVTLFQSTGLGAGGTICDITNYTSACSLEILGTQASATATTSPTVYTGLGTMQRNAFTGPGFADLDMSGEKETKIFEGLSFTLRADAFDILNHPNFGQPSGNVQSATFGQITWNPICHQRRRLIAAAPDQRQVYVLIVFHNFWACVFRRESMREERTPIYIRHA